MLNPAIELGSNACPWNCTFCFTEDPSNKLGFKRRLLGEMSIEQKLQLIDDIAALGARSINFVGAGEPTIDKDFWPMLERMQSLGIVPIVYTEATLRLRDPAFVQRLYELGATVVVKVNSLANPEYQNAIVRGDASRKPARADNYFEQRAEAIQLLIETGFADHDPTRLAFDTIISKQNVGEVLDIHRYARQNNIFVLFINYLPSGRSSDALHDALTQEEQFEVFRQIAEVDRAEFGLEHDSIYPYSGGTPCTIRGLGLYIKIRGTVWDCPGELESLGDLRKESIKEIWQRAWPITASFDGGCAPRDDFWANYKPTK